MTVTINGTTGITTPGVNSTGSNTLGDNVTDTLNVGNGAIVTDSSGNVGIGTSSPSFKLDVNGRVNGADLSTSTGNLFCTVGGTTYGQILTTVGAMTIDAKNNSNLVFQVASSEKMRIDSSGNLLVGKTSTSGSGIVFYGGSDGYSVWQKSNASGAYIQWNNNSGTNVGTITTNGSTTAYNTTSDYRLKENIQPMQGALDVVAQLNPVTYTWKADGSDGQGFIAHELQAVVPDCVTGEKDAVDADGKPVYQGIDTSFLVATLTKAIQELSAKVDAQQAEIEALKGVQA